VTLNVTLATRAAIYQTGDFRLTNTTTGKYEDYSAQKQVLVQRYDWTALVAFAGVGSVGKLSVSGWLAGQIAKIPMDGSVEQLITLVLEADSWLRNVPRQHRRHTFTVGAFVGRRPLIALISNFQSMNGREEASARNMLTVTRRRPSHPAVILGGSGAASVTDQDQARLIGFVRSNASSNTIHEALADLNGHVATLDQSVSPGCFTSHLAVDGTGHGIPHGIDTQQEYSPDFALEGLKQLGLSLRPAVDEHGRPKPIQLRQMAIGRSAASEEEFQARIRDNPDNPEPLNNYGAYLKDIKRDPVKAEEYYRRALTRDPNFASALNNLANVLWERGEYDEADEFYRRAIKASATNILFLVNYANFLTVVRQDFAQAAELYERAFEQNANDPYVLGWYADFLSNRQDDPQVVQSAYDRVFQVAPEHAIFRGNYASYLSDTRQDYERAAQEYERAIAADPDNDRNLERYLRFLLTHTANAARAAELCRRLLKRYPNDAGLLNVYAVALTRSGGSSEEVKRLYRTALEVSPGDPPILANLAQQMWIERRESEALELSHTSLGNKASEGTAVEVWFYLYAHSAENRTKALSALKRLIGAGVRSPGWDFSRNVERSIEDQHPEQELVRELARVIAEDASVEELTRYQAWQEAVD
jgi:tetratricopeptide (TPR) repeat protein